MRTLLLLVLASGCLTLLTACEGGAGGAVYTPPHDNTNRIR